MQALAVALTAAVGLVPAFAQTSAAQSVPQSALVLPVGDEPVDDELDSIVGESFVADILADTLWAAGLGAASRYLTARTGAPLEVSVGAGLAPFTGSLAGRRSGTWNLFFLEERWPHKIPGGWEAPRVC